MGGNGHIIPNSPIAVDFWDTTSNPHTRLFFLTHFHEDHMVGLTSSWDFPIYASPLTCKFLEKITGVRPNLLCYLEIGVKLFLPIDHEGKEKCAITAFSANHCPGALMLLFEGYFGNVLYTGDFRYKPGLLDFASLPLIHVLYLDNTYCLENCYFPSFSDTLDLILERVHRCLQKSKRIYIGMDNLGKEELLKALAEETHSRVWVNGKRKEILEILGLSSVLASEEKENVKLHVVPVNQINGFNFSKWNAEMPSCALLPTARFCSFQFKPYSKYENIHIIPLSNHSSFLELKEFVKQIGPCAIEPIISKDCPGIFGIDLSSRADMSVFADFITKGIDHLIVVPQSVDIAMTLWSQNSQPVARTKRKKKTNSRPKPSKANYIRAKESSESGQESDVDTPAVQKSVHEGTSLSDSSERFMWEIVHITAKKSKKTWLIV